MKVKKSFMPYKVEGYWRATKSQIGLKFDSQLPWPRTHPDAESVYGRDEFLIKLQMFEAKARAVGYKGWSRSRLTGECNGSREYEYRGWTWPEGYQHYIEHGVLPSRAFYEFVTGVDNPKLPQRHIVGVILSMAELQKSAYAIFIGQRDPEKPFVGWKQYLGQTNPEKMLTLVRKFVDADQAMLRDDVDLNVIQTAVAFYRKYYKKTLYVRGVKLL